MRTILTVLLTSLVWSVVILAFFEPRAKSEETTPPAATTVEPSVAPTPSRAEKKAEKRSEKRAQTAAPVTENIDYTREIDGKWTPVEGAKYDLEFTKYGTVIQHNGSLLLRHTYSLSGKKMNIGYGKARIEIVKEGENFYLEIYNSEKFSGRYRRTSQPRKIAMRPLDESLYTDIIVGKWSVINGQEHAIEFTKYGTAIQYNGSLDLRHDYSLSGEKLKIQYDNARIAISEDASYYYLEIYNSEDFSGRYRKSK